MKRRKFKDNDEIVRKMVKINREFAEASIRVSLNVNKISVKYAKRIGFTWKHSNKRNNSHMDDGYIGFIHSIEVVINDERFVQKFHIMKVLPVDVALGMPWFAAFRYRCKLMKNGDNNVDFVRIENGDVSMISEKNICRKEPEKKYMPDIRMMNNKDPKGRGINEMKMEHIPVVSNDENNIADLDENNVDKYVINELREDKMKGEI
ncbi:17619_t:CDS:2, partial [Racocetra persica]